MYVRMHMAIMAQVTDRCMAKLACDFPCLQRCTSQAMPAPLSCTIHAASQGLGYGTSDIQTVMSVPLIIYNTFGPDRACIWHFGHAEIGIGGTPSSKGVFCAVAAPVTAYLPRLRARQMNPAAHTGNLNSMAGILRTQGPLYCTPISSKTVEAHSSR